MLSKLFSDLRGLLKILFCVTGVALIAALVIVGGPQLHGDYIRSTVGSKVVKIMLPNSGGTGFHVVAPSGETYILTNEHICNGSQDGFVEVRMRNQRPMTRRIIDEYDNHDLCLVEGLPGVRGISLASRNPRIGQVVGVVGHPRLNALTFMRGEIINRVNINLVVGYNQTESECSGQLLDVSDDFGARLMGIYNVCLKLFDTFQTTYISYPGNSGSPTVNFRGQLVGVHFAGRRDMVTDGYIVPLNHIKEFLRNY